jgi:hypothetical protein
MTLAKDVGRFVEHYGVVGSIPTRLNSFTLALASLIRPRPTPSRLHICAM